MLQTQINLSKLGVFTCRCRRKAPLKDLYDASVINDIVAGLDVAERWGVKEGQLSAASKINSQIINREVREVIDGNKSASDAVAAINSQISDID